MAEKIKFTKQEQKKQQDALKQFKRFLPTLQLKKQQLQAEVRRSADLLEENLRRQSELKGALAQSLIFFGDTGAAKLIEEKVRIAHIRSSEQNIAGVPIPVFEGIDFVPVEIDRFATDWYVDDAVDALKRAAELKEEFKILQKQYDLLAEELRTTGQRVNLFEKVKIPECQENIRKIRIMLGDLETSAVARSKIAKRKTAAAVN
ncbi:MAG: V-type ATP synthase subunit D [Lentisphaeria bacterium]|nr:V-type ATP synthase subunit D [Lentisphaeria bacterium]